jgi:hypothetical protein
LILEHEPVEGVKVTAAGGLDSAGFLRGADIVPCFGHD